LVDRVLFLSVVFDLVLTIGVFMCFFSSVVCMVLLYYTLKDTRILVCCDYSVVSFFYLSSDAAYNIWEMVVLICVVLAINLTSWFLIFFQRFN
jgi:hypothetical protein